MRDRYIPAAFVYAVPIGFACIVALLVVYMQQRDPELVDRQACYALNDTRSGYDACIEQRLYDRERNAGVDMAR